MVHSSPYQPQSKCQTGRAVQNIESLLKRKLQKHPLANDEQIIFKLQREIRLAHMPLLSGKSPAKLMYSFNPNTRFNSWYRQAIHMPLINSLKVMGHHGDRLVKIDIEVHQRRIHLDQIDQKINPH